MAKLPRGAMSQAIRDELTANPAATPKDVIATLKAKGINVTGQMVSSLRGKMAVGGKKKRGRKKKSEVGVSDQVSLGVLVQAKKLADQLGGVAKAKAALDALAKLK